MVLVVIKRKFYTQKEICTFKETQVSSSQNIIYLKLFPTQPRILPRDWEILGGQKIDQGSYQVCRVVKEWNLMESQIITNSIPMEWNDEVGVSYWSGITLKFGPKIVVSHLRRIWVLHIVPFALLKNIYKIEKKKK